MFPCIGQLVAAPPEDAADHKSPICLICGEPLTKFDKNLPEREGLCSACHDRFMTCIPT